MPNHSETTRLDSIFHALAHPTRRAVLERIGAGPRSVSELAEPFDIALPSFLQHLAVLEDSGLVRSRKAGRVRTVEPAPAGLRPARGWLVEQAEHWERRLSQLDDHLDQPEGE